MDEQLGDRDAAAGHGAGAEHILMRASDALVAEHTRIHADIVIVTPVYNDWPSFESLMVDLDRALAGTSGNISIVAVDDGSPLPPPLAFARTLHAIDRVEIVSLTMNLGHQRAIAAGLCRAQEYDPTHIVVMDSDGEDRASDVVLLLEEAVRAPDAIIVAQRRNRSESLGFRLFYKIYKFLFWLGTGVSISHGNFCVIPGSRIIPLLHNPNTWNHLAACIVRCKIPFESVSVDRGTRFFGESKMNFPSLVIHGLSAISVYMDYVATRLMLFCFMILAFATISSAVVIGIRLFSHMAIPGWTTSMLSFFVILTFQALVLSASIIFSLLLSRTQVSVLPSEAARRYISKFRLVYGHD